MAADVTINVNAVDNFSGVLGDFGNIVTGIKSAIDLAGEAFTAATEFAGQFVDSAAESQVAVTQLETILKSTGDTFGVTSEQLQNMATNMMNMSGFSDEAEMSAEGMLLRFENLNGVFPQALQLTNDLARSLGIDLTTAAQTIGKALDDPASGIGRLNTQFKLFNDVEMTTIKQMAENGDVAGAQALIMERLTEKVGGAAAAYGTTFSGALDIAKEKLDNVKELIGGAMLPALTTMIDAFQQIMDSPAAQQFLDTVVKNIKIAADAVADFVTSKLPALLNALNSGNYSAIIQIIFGDIDVGALLADLDAKVAAAINAGIAAGTFREAGAAFGDWLDAALGMGIGEMNTGQAGPALGKALGDFIRGAVGDVYFQHSAQDIASALLQMLLDAIRTAFTNASTAIYNSAINIGQSIGDGMRAGLEQAWNSNPIGAWIWDHIINPVKNILGIQSPSTIFMQIGTDIVNGLILGITSLENAAIAAFQSIISGILNLPGISQIAQLLGISVPAAGTTPTNAAGGILGTGIDRNAEGDFTLPTGTGTTTGVGGTGACVFNNYGTIYVGSMAQLYECPSPHPLLAASGATLLNTTIVP